MTFMPQNIKIPGHVFPVLCGQTTTKYKTMNHDSWACNELCQHTIDEAERKCFGSFLYSKP